MIMSVSFREYMRRVDSVLLECAGITHLDIGDSDWYDSYESEIDPREAARDALEDEGFPF